MKHFLRYLVFGVALISLCNSVGAQRNRVIVPLLDVKSGYLLGGSRGGQWVNAKTTALSLQNGTKYQVFSATRALGEGQATAPNSQGAPCNETLWSQISPDFSRRNAEIALGGVPKPLLRVPRIENVNQASYRKIVAAILRSHGIARPVVQISQIWRVDLDGDGQSEVLLTATRKPEVGNDKNSIPTASRAGDYSMLLLRRLVRGRVENRLLIGDFYPRGKKFNAPQFYKIAAIFDANGDGKMEFLVRARYYEGSSSILYSARGDAVLNEGCGA